MDDSPYTEPKQEHSSFGPMVAIVILVLLLLAGGVYFFLEQRERFVTPPVEEVINAY